MSDSLRVRLEFKKFSNPGLRNSLLSFKKNEVKNVKSLHLLIQKRYNLEKSILLLIDGFVLEPTESIDVLRDNDLIVIEPKIEVSLTKVKTESKSETKIKFEKKLISNEISFSSYFSDKIKNEFLPKTEAKIKSEKTKKPKTHEKTKSKEYISSDTSSEEPKNLDTFVDVKYKPGPKSRKKLFANEVKPRVQSGHKPITASIKTPEKTYSKLLKTEIVSILREDKNLKEPEITSMRNIPLRKAFQNAATSLKKRPQTSADSTATTSDTPKPKRRRNTKEALEPVDRFSPIIVLERQHIQNEDTSFDTETGFPLNANIRKQSARKSFPNPSRKVINENNRTNNTKTNENSAKNEKLLIAKTIDFENCEPLVSIPSVGDIIAFKILTLSADGNGYESSLFKVGSVISANKDTQMVDILLQDVIKRNNLQTFNKSDEHILGIHALKINWSTVLEPKLVRRQSEPELIVL